MKTLNKMIMGGLVMAVLLLITAPAVQAQAHQSLKFMNVPAFYATNLLNFTNLNTAMVAGNGRTNAAGTVYSNYVNGVLTRVIVNTTSDATNTKAASQNVFKEVPLWVDTGGRGPWDATNTSITRVSFATLSVSTIAGAGADTAITLVFTPIWNGVNEATESADEWSTTVTPTVSATQTFSANVPLYKWPGAKYLRLRRVVNADTTAAGNVIFTDISLNGFVP